MLLETAALPGSRWAGADLPALEFESMTSVMLLFAWRNALHWDVLRQYRDLALMTVGIGVTGRKDVSGYPQLSQVQWEDNSRRSTVFPRLTSGRFRYCPLCLECGYHSQLYQALPITCCPFHHADLTDICQCCGAHTPELGDAHSLFKSPYHCDLCGTPLGGVFPTMDAVLDFRTDFEATRAAMEPYITWWDCVKQVSTRVGKMWRNHPGDLVESSCYVEDIVRALADKQMGCPELTQTPFYATGEVVTLDWICRSREIPWAEQDICCRADYGQPAYLATLKRLRLWIAKVEGWTVEEFDFRVAARSTSNEQNAPVRFLAFLALRSYMESPFALSAGHRLCVQEEAQLSMTYFKNIPRFEFRTARLEWRAIFLAMYAYWHARLLRVPRQELQRVWEEAKGYRDHILIRSQYFELLRTDTTLYSRPPGRVAWFEGEVSFVRVPGMPMWPWDRSGRSRHGAAGDVPRVFPSMKYGVAVPLELLNRAASKDIVH